MLRLQRPLLLGLLCLLLLSWGTCPCVLSRAFASEADEELTPEIGCPCCRKHAEEAAKAAKELEEPAPHEECPCCARGGAYRDLPPAGEEVTSPPMPTDYDLWFPAIPTTAWEWPSVERWHLEATGPPRGSSLHGCPVGIVLLLN